MLWPEVRGNSPGLPRQVAAKEAIEAEEAKAVAAVVAEEAKVEEQAIRDNDDASWA